MSNMTWVNDRKCTVSGEDSPISFTPSDLGLEAEKDTPEDHTSTPWDTDPHNPYNWPTRSKIQQVVMIALAAFTTSLGVSILSPAHAELMSEFDVGSTVAILPLSLYVFALALGPLVGGPLSETIGRYPVYLASISLGSLFTLGVGLSTTFPAVCILRFCAGFCFASPLAIAAGTINETFRPAARAIPSIIFIMTPFLGPGLGPVIGSFVVNRKGWRWTQWTMLFFAICTMLSTLIAGETFHPVIKRRRSKIENRSLATPTEASSKVRSFASIALFRPIQMMCSEPIVELICLYVACEFATLFSFFAACPFVFQGVYGFGLESTGLVFLSIIVGCFLGAVTVLLVDVFVYRPKAARFQGQKIPPELRLYPSLIGSFGLPASLFWFGWTANTYISWLSPTAAMALFAWANFCVFVSTAQYIVDTYHELTVASAMSANSLARYGLAGAFPLFTIQMYTNLGIGWASSVLGLLAVCLLPVPWVLFTYGGHFRSLSRFQTAS